MHWLCGSNAWLEDTRTYIPFWSAVAARSCESQFKSKDTQTTFKGVWYPGLRIRNLYS